MKLALYLTVSAAEADFMHAFGSKMRGALVAAATVAVAVEAAPPKPHIFMMIVDVRCACHLEHQAELKWLHVMLVNTHALAPCRNSIPFMHPAGFKLVLMHD